MTDTSVYRTIMGEAFDRLDANVKAFHTFAGHHVFHGTVQVAAPNSLLGKILALALGSPLKDAKGPLRFELLASPEAETWTRFFPNKTMRSTFTTEGVHLVERLGVARLCFSLLERDGALEMRLEKMRFLGVPCPRWLLPQVTARETGQGHSLHFEVKAVLPWIGLVTGYTGYLDIG